jgi:hypothetical protein
MTVVIVISYYDVVDSDHRKRCFKLIAFSLSLATYVRGMPSPCSMVCTEVPVRSVDFLCVWFKGLRFPVSP